MKTVIFACVHNAGRSQMAAAFFNVLAAQERARALSAGTEPGERVHPEVLATMRELGVDLSGAKPQRLTEELAKGASWLITMGCGDRCPVIPGAKRDDWPLPDPKAKPIEEVRRIRDDVRRRVARFVAEQGWDGITLRRATPEDLPAVEALLGASGLPLEGVRDHFAGFTVAQRGAEIAGAAGLERHGRDALLRSVVVAPALRGTGLGVRLHDALIDQARREGLDSVSLLTTTAAAFFEKRGFQRVERGQLPGSLSNSAELRGACPDTAVAMRRTLR